MTDITVSYTQLTTFKLCAAKWYAKYVLKKESPYENAAMVRGLSVERYCTEIIINDAQPNEAKEVALTYFHEKIKESTKPNEPIKLKAETALTKSLIENMTSYAQQAKEYTGINVAQQKILYELLPGINIVGYIDFARIEEKAGLVSVLDLKTSKKTIEEITDDFVLQLALYGQASPNQWKINYQLWHASPKKTRWFSLLPEVCPDERHRMKHLLILAKRLTKKIQTWYEIEPELAVKLLMPNFEHFYAWTEAEAQELAIDCFLSEAALGM